MQRLRRSRPVAVLAATAVAETDLRSRLIVGISALLAYAPIYFVLHDLVGPAADAYSVVPAALAGWVFGVRGGLAVAAALVFLHSFAHFAIHTAAHGGVITLGPLSSVLTLVASTAVSGGFRRMYLSAKTRAAEAETQRAATERISKELRRSYESLDAVLETVPIQLIRMDGRGVIESYYGRPLDGTGLSAQDLVGRNYLELRRDHPVLPDQIRRALLGEQIDEVVKTGSLWAHVRATPVVGADGRVEALNAVCLDVTDRIQALEEARRVSSTDRVTGLPNRDEMWLRGTAALAEEGAVAGLIILDLDGFQDLNEAFGFDLGDEVLRVVGGRVSSVVGTTGSVACSGADRFTVLLPGATPQEIRDTVRRIQSALEVRIEFGGHAVEVTASIGSACAPDDGSTFFDLIKRAETARYAAQRQHAGYRAYTKDLAMSDPERVSLLADLRRAIEDDTLELEYQPVVSLEDRRTIGVEGLLRWRHPVRGSVSPASFVPFVERSPLGRELSRWVARRMWHDTRTLAVIAGPLSFALNLSARDLGNAEVMAEIAALRRRVGESGRITVEVTESDVMADPERAIASLTALRATGVKISIDDFGTGYSSLAYLHRLPVDELKIDKSFVARMADDPRAREIVRATIAIAHALGLKVVGEGCEDERALEMLRDLGCDRAQGWGIARAMTVERLAAWLFEQARAPLHRVALTSMLHTGHDPVATAAD